MARNKKTYGVFCNTANQVVMVAGVIGILALAATKYSVLVSSLVADMIRMW